MNKTIWLIIAFICVLSIGYFIGHNPLKKERASNVANITAYRDTVKRSRVEINGLTNFVALKNAIIEDQNTAIKSGLLERERLKALHLKEVAANAKLTAKVSVLRDSLKLVPGTTIITVKDTAGNYASYVKIPFQLLKINEKDLILNAGMDTSKHAWFDFTSPISGELTLGWQRDGLFKTKPVGVFTSTNEHLTVTDMESIIIKENKKFYQRTWFHFLSGAAAASAIFLVK